MSRFRLILVGCVSIGLLGSRADGQSRYTQGRGSSGRYERGDHDTRRHDRAANPSRRSHRFKTAHERLPRDIPEWFIEKDADEDGQVMMAEFSTKWDDALLTEFGRFDRDGDGFVTPKECLAARAEGAIYSGRAVSAPTAPRNATDALSTDSLTPAEGEPTTTTPRNDATAEPAETPAESETKTIPSESESEPATAEEEGEDAAAEPDGPKSPAPENIEIPAAYLNYSISFIRKYDTDKNGMLTTDEWAAMPKSPESADRNGDGRVTPQEHALSIMKR